MAVPRDYNPYALPTTQQYAAPYSDGSLDDLVASKNTILQGATLRTSNFAGRTATVKPGENINAAIGTLKSAGGGILFLQAGTYTLSENIVGGSKISIIGEGRDQTILDFGGGAYGVQYIGTSSVIVADFRISDLTVQNSNNAAGIDVDYADYWNIRNVRVTSCDQKGIRINRSQHYILSDVIANSNTGNGVDVLASGTRHNQYGSFQNVLSTLNGGIGFYITDSSTSSLVQYFVFVHCIASSNTGDGFDLTGTITTGAYSDSRGSYLGCQSISNGGIGFDINQYVRYVSFVGIVSIGNTGDNIELGGTSINVVGGIVADSSAYNININTTAVNIIVTGVQQPIGGSSSPKSFVNVSPNLDVEITAINSGSHRTEQRIKRMKCITSGVAAGDVVVFDPTGTAEGEGFNSTTTVGDDRVCGVVLAGINQDSWGDILVEGYTTLLHVDGTTDIAVGDFLCTSGTARVAQKAAAGNMAFAIALEAYTGNDTNGSINALVIIPRKL